MNGLLIIDKPAGLTSHDVVARVRRTVGEKRVGHTGTLDPFATGVLVVMVGRATRLAQFLSGAEKEYEALVRLGYGTDTGDFTGTRTEAFTAGTQSLRREEIETALASLRGEIDQTPPMYSAKKIAGEKLYELARRGEQVERKAVRVNVAKFEIDQNNDELKPNDDGTTDLPVRVVCSAGTYVRALAESLGQTLSTGAHLAELRRTRAGSFKIEDAITFDRLDELAATDSLSSVLISPYDALSDLPTVQLNADDAKRTLSGIDLPAGNDASTWPDEQAVRLIADGHLLAVGIYSARRQVIHPKVVVADLSEPLAVAGG